MSEAQKEALKSLYVDAEPVESSKNLKNLNPALANHHSYSRGGQSLRQFQWYSLVHGRTAEVALAFWGFVQDRHTRNELLSVLCDTLKPRVAFAANTRESGFECIMVIDDTGAAALATALARRFLGGMLLLV